MLCTRRALSAYAASLLTVAALAGLSGCSDKVASNGGTTAANGGGNGAPAVPKKLILGFVPSTEADKIAEDAKPMAEYLSKALGIPVETYTSTGYTGLIEAMASGKVDIGSLPPLGYVLAKDRHAAEVLLKTKRHGAITYHTMFITRADSGIKSILDAKGKRMAFVDPASTSGFLIPASYLKGKGIDYNTFFSQTVFAGSHDGAVRAIYDGDEDVAAVYDDARNKLENLPAYKDVKTKVVKIGVSGEIPNDTISVRTGLDPALVAKIKKALVDYAASPDGKKTLEQVYEVDGVVDAQDSDYDPVRVIAKSMDVQFSSLDTKKPTASPSGAAKPSAGAAAPANPAASPAAVPSAK
jgi:phosphonate transport system substrate-binding protein